MSQTNGFVAGVTVRLRDDVKHTCPEGRDDNETAVIEMLLPNLAEGALRTEADLRGCRYWNVDDLELVAA